MQIKRSPDQTLIAFACHVELLRALDLARDSSGDDRSSFIRKAVFAELKQRKFPVEEAWIKPPDRAKKSRYPEVPPPHLANSGKVSAGGTSAKAAPGARRAAKSGPKRKVVSPSGKTSGPASRARGR